jgi:hypothetical protein
MSPQSRNPSATSKVQFPPVLFWCLEAIKDNKHRETPMLRRVIQTPAMSLIVPSAIFVGFMVTVRWALGMPLLF